MNENFPERLRKKVLETKAPCVIGLDPRPQNMPVGIKSNNLIEKIKEFHGFVMDQAKGKVPCVKPQVAFFEALGRDGYGLFIDTCLEAREKGFIVIGDVKRSDIGSTAKAYADAYFTFCDAVTVNPFLGTDSIEPFLEWCRSKGKGIFVLARTSNRRNELQELEIGGKTLAQVVAEMINLWATTGEMPLDSFSGYSPVGAVVGGTHAKEIPLFRKILRKSWLLIPGYGAQGAKAQDLKDAFDENGLGAIVNSSRGITACFSPGDHDWKEKIAAAIESFVKEIKHTAGF